MNDRFETRRDPLLDEEVWLARSASGLPVRVVPTDRFREAMAVITFRYGSTDLGFAAGGREVRTPEGMAHYLEHKLFEDEALQVFDRFARRGARVNAMTGFAQTSYHFTATDRLRENLEDLLHVVARAHITDENVEKERGIIAQEIRMYEDSPDYRLFFDFLGCLYAEHPVRHPVGGTVASIQRITAADLLTCYGAFYRTGNAALAVAGPVDPQEVLAIADASALAAGEPPPSLRPADTGPVRCARADGTGDVARARVMIGCKDRTNLADAGARLQRELVTKIMLDRLFSPASEVREDLRTRGIVDDSLNVTYLADDSFGFTAVSCETDEPERAAAELRALLLTPVPMDEGFLGRVRCKFLGKYVRSFASVSSQAIAQAQEALHGVEPFGAIDRMEAVALEDLRARQAEHFAEEALAVAVLHRGNASAS
jgi:predicted Zn-dependent peptidase